MPTRAQIEDADETLDGLAQAQWLALIRQSAAYKEQPGLYPNLATKLSEVSAIQAQQLNAALALIDETGDGTVELSGGEDGVGYSQEGDRDQLVEYGLRILYDQPIRGSQVAVGQINNPLTGRGCCPVCPLSYTRCCGHGVY